MSKFSKHITKKSKMIAATAFLLGVVAIGGTGLAYADTSSTKTEPFATLASTIAQKFHLDTNDVQTVVDQVMSDQRAQREAGQKQKLADRLATAVSAGTLTQAQADLITAKVAELQANRVAMKGKTQAERSILMKTQQDALKVWATANNIPDAFAHFGPIGGHGVKSGHNK